MCSSLKITCDEVENVRQWEAMKQIRNWKLEIGNLEEEILETIQYFLFFDYPPTLEEIHGFLKKRCSRRRMMSILEKMEKKSLIKSWKLEVRGEKLEKKMRNMIHQTSYFNDPVSNFSLLTSLNYCNNTARYTVGQYRKKSQVTGYRLKEKISLSKIKRILPYVKLLSLFPQIKLIGLSGSVAMLNARKDHDVDLFVITAKNRLFTGRLIALFLAQIMGIRRPFQLYQRLRNPENQINRSASDVSDSLDNLSLRFSDKVCLNLFFDEKDMVIPIQKRSDYVAHEVLQMKPFDFAQGKPLKKKNDTYLRFIDANKWVFEIFPNAKQELGSKNQESRKNKKSIVNTYFLLLASFGDLLESLLKNLQLYFIRRHQTTELITNSQLWFHPDDFEKKMKKTRL